MTRWSAADLPDGKPGDAIEVFEQHIAPCEQMNENYIVVYWWTSGGLWECADFYHPYFSNTIKIRPGAPCGAWRAAWRRLDQGRHGGHEYRIPTQADHDQMSEDTAHMPRPLKDRLADAAQSQQTRLGRPPLPAEQRLKQRAARWTDSAWEACERKAQAAGLSTAAWVRKVTEDA